MNIAFIVGRFPSLTQTFIANQAVELLGRGHDLTIFSLESAKDATENANNYPEELLESIQTIPRPAVKPLKSQTLWKHLTTSFGHSRNVRDFFNLLGFQLLGDRWLPHLRTEELPNLTIPFLDRDRSFDVIHAHFGQLGLVAVTLREAGLIEGKLVTTFYGYDMGRFPERYSPESYKCLLDEADLLLPICSYFEQLLTDWGAPPERTRVHHLGIDPGEFEPAGHRNKSTSVILTVARLTEKKGIPDGLRAVDQIRDQVDLEYHVLGDGPLRDHFKRVIGQLELEDEVTLHGTVSRSRVRDWLGKADLLLQPSMTAEDGDVEGTPTVILEAMASELPVVSTNHSGIPEMVTDGESGYLVDEHDVEGLASSMVDLLEDPDKRMTFGQHGRRIVEAQFDISKLVTHLEEHYESLVNTKRPC